MKRQRPITAIPGFAIALFATALGITIVGVFRSGTQADHDRPFVFGSSPLGVATVGAFALVVIGLVVLKTLAERQHQTERGQLEAFLEYIPDNVFFKDCDSRFVRISRAMAEHCGLADPKLALRKTDSDIFTSEHADKALADEKEIIRSGEPMIGIEEKETWPDGHESWVLTTKVPLKDRRGHIIGTMGIAHNISDRKSAEARMHYMALHDPLTELPNRILLVDRLAQLIALANRNQKRVGVLILDLDRFKNVNDSFGHRAGDRLLEVVSRRLKSCLRDSDVLARLEGDEFVVGVPMVDNIEDIERVAQRVLAALVEPFQIEGSELRVSASTGICEYPADGANPEALLKSADVAMYEAKKKRNGSYCFFSKQLCEKIRNRHDLEDGLRQACSRNEFVLYYQPLVSTESGRITGVEALLRWQHPERGLISPGEFIPQLEEMGLMEQAGEWVLRTACIQNTKWQREGLPAIRVAVNLSAQQFYRGDIVNTVEQVLRETGLDSKWLELELTETLTLDASDNTTQIMHDLKRTGITLSLDDFGTGWSSLSYLSRFPLDRLKIDRSFMRDIASQSAARAVVESILNLARNLGLTCVGEGVETRPQLNYLREKGCAEIQGFLFSPPLPAVECAALLRTGKTEFIDAPSCSEGSNRAMEYNVPLDGRRPDLI